MNAKLVAELAMPLYIHLISQPTMFGKPLHEVRKEAIIQAIEILTEAEKIISYVGKQP